MGKVTYNQAGYDGSSMSERAREAYADGEAPKSKWTKRAMLAALADWAEDNDRVLDEAVENLNKDVIFSRFFEWKSWHHTGKFAAETDFYGVNEDATEEASHEMSDAEEELRRANKELRRAQDEAARWARLVEERTEEVERAQARVNFERANGCVWDSIAGYVARKTALADKMGYERPRFRTSAKGSLMLETIAETFNLTSSQSLTHFVECEFHVYKGTPKFGEVYDRVVAEAEAIRRGLAVDAA